jgi:hypothetical protein
MPVIRMDDPWQTVAKVMSGKPRQAGHV